MLIEQKKWRKKEEKHLVSVCDKKTEELIPYLDDG